MESIHFQEHKTNECAVWSECVLNVFMRNEWFGLCVRVHRIQWTHGICFATTDPIMAHCAMIGVRDATHLSTLLLAHNVLHNNAVQRTTIVFN